jgi:hypothetical protein
MQLGIRIKLARACYVLKQMAQPQLDNVYCTKVRAWVTSEKLKLNRAGNEQNSWAGNLRLSLVESFLIREGISHLDPILSLLRTRDDSKLDPA